MKLTRIACLALVAVTSITTANAGGLLTNTNQSISFLRNPAREAAIGIDGVYSNPAGVAFMDLGWHFGVNWQCAVQTRTVDTTSPYLDHTLQATDANAPTKRYRGHASAPCIPSLQAAYNMKKWSFQFQFAVTGGGGKCDFEKGLGTFESAVGNIATQLKALGVMGYGVDNYMEGRQYYYGITLGAAYKINKNVSVYAGVRGLIASSKYIAQIKDIQVSTDNGLLNLSDFITTKSAYLTAQSDALVQTENYLNDVISKTKTYYDQYGSNYDKLKEAQTAGKTDEQTDLVIKAIESYKAAVAGQSQVAAGKQQIAAGQAGLAQLEPYKNGIDLEDKQTGFGIAPIFGVDWKFGRFNLAAKYEFRTIMNLKNSSNLAEASLPATAQFVDGTKVREDSPALLAVGVQYSPIDRIRINAGYHHFYDKDACKTYFTQDATGSIVRNDHKNDLLSSGTNEYLGGVEVDLTDRLTVSCGGQITRYGMTDEYMSDISFVTNSKSLGFGAKYKANEWVTIQAAYFKTFYDHYKTANGMQDFTRTNDVIGVGCEIDF